MQTEIKKLQCMMVKVPSELYQDLVQKIHETGMQRRKLMTMSELLTTLYKQGLERGIKS